MYYVLILCFGESMRARTYTRKPHNGWGWPLQFSSSYIFCPLYPQNTNLCYGIVIVVFFTHAELPTQLMTNQQLSRSLQVFCYFYAFYSIKNCSVGPKKLKQAPFIETENADGKQLLLLVREREHAKHPLPMCIGSSWKFKRTTHVFTLTPK